ncbi:MAG: sigma-54-dependent Fis family transcriptional regulator [Phycisphaerales bacterium]|nr:sigma-54-dependent Fis family transcriptional regulator [Phycisphaerales bacterium]
MRSVLVVDDKELMRESVGGTLERAGFTVATASDAPSAVQQIAAKRPDVVVTDLKMPGMTGIELLERIRQIDDDLPVVLMTAFGTIETAVSAIKQGAFDYLTKPFEGDELVITVKRAAEHGRVLRENKLLRAAAGLSENSPAIEGADRAGGPSLQGVSRLVGDSEPMRKLRDQIRAIAISQGTILISGPSGSGKEVVARSIHEMSPRKSGAFLAVNCAALSESLLESELFGHEKGAFTGAEKLRKGRFELADGGTLLLDEISEVSPRIQAKLLRVLQERNFERVGSSLSIGVDVRVIATSNRDMTAAVAAGEFRQDLFFRLNVLPVHVPPLADRVADVGALANHFVAMVCKREGRACLKFNPDAVRLLQGYGWPGNVRELQNICERAVVLLGRTDSDEPVTVGPEALHSWLNATPVRATPLTNLNGLHTSNGQNTASHPNGHPAASAQVEGKPTASSSLSSVIRTLEELEREAIIEALHKFNGHRQRTASALGIGVRTLGLKLKKWKELRLVEATL